MRYLLRELILLPLLLGSALGVLLAEEGRSRPLLSWRRLHVLVLRAIGTGTDRAGHATCPRALRLWEKFWCKVTEM